MEIKKEYVYLFLIIIFLWWIFNPLAEGFDDKAIEFVPVGEQRYGLRGDRLNLGDIARNYMSPKRHIVIHPSNEIMWKSNNPPAEEAIPNCKKVSCPTYMTDFDQLDTCHQCGSLNGIN